MNAGGLLASAAMAAPRFDLRALFSAVDAERQRRGLTWAAVGPLIGVSPSTIRRFDRADDAEADGVLAAIRWLDAIPEAYLTGGETAGTRLPAAGEGHVRVDMEVVAEANGDARGASGRTRTTIQALVAAADRSQQPIAALTRLSDM